MRDWAKKYDKKKDLPEFVHLSTLKKFLESIQPIKSFKFRI